MVFLKKEGHEDMCRLIFGWFRCHKRQTVDLEPSLATLRVVSKCNVCLTSGQWPGIVDPGLGVLQNLQLMWYPCPSLDLNPSSDHARQGLGLMVCSCAEYGDLDHR